MCDCTIFPFKPDPPCFKICAARMLNNISPEELQVVLGLSHKVAKTIACYVLGKKEVESLEEYEEVLSPKDMRTLEKRIRSLNSVQVKYLMNPLAIRMDVIRNLKENVIDFAICENIGIEKTGYKNVESYKGIKRSEPI